MATQLKVHGKTNEATIVSLDAGWSFQCSQGAWCDRQDDIHVEDGMQDAVHLAILHVEMHDLASVLS
jgi:hypothetical protein